VAGLQRQTWRGALQRLDAAHLVATQHMNSSVAQTLGLGIQGTNLLDLLRELGRVITARMQPVAAAMWCNFSLTLKSARPNGLKYA
jgi:hypothetical protein